MTLMEPQIRPGAARAGSSRGRAGIIVVMILSLLASAGARFWADRQRESDIPNHGEASAGTSLSNMDSFALGLLLGGLRGPLVMFLWTQSESQKTEKNLEGFDTQIEWIRLLQPEFDTVHIFEIWNKAYNISVQMASLANKYTVILDALDYAHSVDREKPDDINILAAMGQLYFDKLGNSSEKLYYRRRVRSETLPHPVAARPSNDPGWRRLRLDPMLDSNFNLLANLIAPKPGRARPADLPANQEWNDGAELQYLAAWQPFNDGVSPFALAYNYYKRAEVLQSTEQQRAQLSDMVIDSRPALSLKNWADEEWEQGRRREAQAFGLVVPEDRDALEQLTAGFGLDRPIADRHAAELAAFAYNRAVDLVPAALAEYVRHISNDPRNMETYRSHMDDLRSERELCAADRDYLAAMLSPPDARAALIASAKQHYLASVYHNEMTELKYFTDAQYLTEALPRGYTRFKTGDQPGIDDMTPAQIGQAALKVDQARAKNRDSHDEDRKEYDDYILHADTRVRLLLSVK